MSLPKICGNPVFGKTKTTAIPAALSMLMTASAAIRIVYHSAEVYNFTHSTRYSSYLEYLYIAAHYRR